MVNQKLRGKVCELLPPLLIATLVLVRRELGEVADVDGQRVVAVGVERFEQLPEKLILVGIIQRKGQNEIAPSTPHA